MAGTLKPAIPFRMVDRAGLFLVHIFTALGGAFALFTVFAVLRGDWSAAFAWLGAALIVDGIDGPMARQLKVVERLPSWDGSALDFIIDYTTYVFVPAVVLAGAFGFGPWLGQALAALVCIVGALYFADKRMKQPDRSFRGFPSAWNMLVFVLYATSLAPSAVLVIVLLFCVLTFLPLKFVHPVRVARWRPVTLTVFFVWALAAAVLIAVDFQSQPLATAVLIVTSLYLCGVGVVQQALPQRRD